MTIDSSTTLPSAGDSIPVGTPIPGDRHSVSVSLPRWQDVVDYEEKELKLSCGYPRFVIHPAVKALAEEGAGAEATALPFPSAAVAQAGAEFIRRRAGVGSRVIEYRGVFILETAATGAQALKDFWQHTGMIVSSRQAEAARGGERAEVDAAAVRAALRGHLARLYDCAESDVFLAPTGMGAQYAALRALQARQPGKRTAQLGFSYVDTFKLQEKTGAGGVLLHDLEHIGKDLGELLATETLAGCFAEVPGNPLLGSADLRQVTPQLRRFRVPLVADDVVATPYNVDLRDHADLVATSLTKFMAGTGDVMGGALVCNPRSPLYGELKEAVAAAHEELLWEEDAAILERHIQGFPDRMRRHNAGGLYIAERLRAHPAVERVWYPKWEFSSAYEAVRKPEGGWSGLITFLPKDAPRRAAGIYDRMAVCKGPSLGTVFTLACPFTLLAHYTELAWAEDRGVSRHLIRLSIGLEPPEQIWAALERALAEGRS